MKIHRKDYLDERISSHGIESLVSEIKRTPKDGLIVWDLDYTILGPNDAMWTMRNISNFRDTFLQKISFMDSEERDLFLNFLCYRVNTELLNPIIRDLVSGSLERGIRTIALSSMTTYDIGDLKKPHEERMKLLGRMGINFSLSEEVKQKGDYILFKGALFSNSVMEEGKGVALVNYLEEFPIEGREILYVDDNTDNFDEIRRCLPSSYDLRCFEMLEAYRFGTDYTGNFSQELDMWISDFRKYVT